MRSCTRGGLDTASASPSILSQLNSTTAHKRTVKCGRRYAGGTSGIKAEDLRDWLLWIEEEEEEGKEGVGDTWRIFVQLIQTIWETGTVPHQMLWINIVLIPKGAGTTVALACSSPCEKW